MASNGINYVFIVIFYMAPCFCLSASYCTPGFKEYADKNGSRLCARFFSHTAAQYNKTETWDDAYKTCRQLQSHLLNVHFMQANLSGKATFFESMTDDLVWFNLRQESRFYMSYDEEPYLFREGKLVWQDLNEPFFKCVALNISSGKLVTRDCNDKKLPFLCLNKGFSTKPFEHIACPKFWLFSHYLMDPYGCIRVFPPTSYYTSLNECERENATLLEKDDYHGIYQVLANGYLETGFTQEAYWIKESPRVSSSSQCEVRAKEAPPRKMKWRFYNCTDNLPFICKKDLSKIDNVHNVRPWISPKEIPPMSSTAMLNQSLTCRIDFIAPFRNFEDLRNNLKYVWFKNDIPISRQRIIYPEAIQDKAKVNLRTLAWQGEYKCMVIIPGIEMPYYAENVVTFFFSDISSYLLSLICKNSYEFPDPSRANFSTALNQFYEHINWTKRINDMRSTLPHSFSIYWNMRDINRRVPTPSIVQLYLQIFFKWPPASRTEMGENAIYSAVKQLLWGSPRNDDVWFPKTYSADSCFTQNSDIRDINGTARIIPGSNARHGVTRCITYLGKNRHEKCIGSLLHGARWKPLSGTCHKTEEITISLKELSKVSVTSDNVINTTRTLANLTSLPDQLQPEALPYIASTLDNIVNNSVYSAEVIKPAAVAVGNVMCINEKGLSDTQRKMNTSSRIVESFETIVLNSEMNGTNLTFALDNIAVDIWQLNETDKLPIGAFVTSNEMEVDDYSIRMKTIFNDTVPPTENYEVGITIPWNLVLERRISSSSRLIVIIYKTPNLFQSDKMAHRSKVISPVVHASVGEEPVWNLDSPVKIYFKHLKRGSTSYTGNITCGYWNQSQNEGSGGWSEDGCDLIDGENQICECNHLTNFGLLLDSTVEVDHPGHGLTLSIISFTGCCLSIFGLGMTLLTYLLFRKWRKEKRHRTLVNLSVALISVLIIFLAGFKSKHEIGCMVVAILLHYFMLATFAWMLVEAALQYLYLVRVYNSYVPRFMIKSMAFAWGLPLLVVCIVLLVDYNLYKGKQEYCWLSENAFYFAFVLPALTLLVINFIVFVLILYSLTCGRDNKRLRNNQDERKFAMMRLRAAVCIYFLLGLSWAFGFIAIVGEGRIFFHYLFAITTTLQGFFVFVFSVAQEKAAQKMWRNFLSTVLSPIQKSNASYSTGADTVNLNTGNK